MDHDELRVVCDTYEEDIDAAMKARIEEDRWSQ